MRKILLGLVETRERKQNLPTVNFDPVGLTLRMDVKDVIPHFPTVPVDLAAVGLLVLALAALSNCILVCSAVLGWLEYFPRP